MEMSYSEYYGMAQTSDLIQATNEQFIHQAQHSQHRETAVEPDQSTPTYNIWVGELDSQTTEQDLINVFQACGAIHSVSVVRDKRTNESKGFGFVNFLSKESRVYALTKLKDAKINGRRIVILASKDKSTLYVGNLPRNTNQEDLRKFLEENGGPLESIILKGGFAFVEYVNYHRAERALNTLKGARYLGNTLKVQPAQSTDKTKSEAPTTVYVSNLAPSVDEETLQRHFEREGSVLKATIIRNHETQESRGYGFVEMDSSESSDAAVKHLDGSELGGSKIRVEFSRPADSKRPPPPSMMAPPGAYPSAASSAASSMPGMYGDKILVYDDRIRAYVLVDPRQGLYPASSSSPLPGPPSAASPYPSIYSYPGYPPAYPYSAAPPASSSRSRGSRDSRSSSSRSSSFTPSVYGVDRSKKPGGRYVPY